MYQNGQGAKKGQGRIHIPQRQDLTTHKGLSGNPSRLTKNARRPSYLTSTGSPDVGVTL